jgi:hypothetical protein
MNDMKNIQEGIERREALRFATYGPKKTMAEIKAFLDTTPPPCPCGMTVSEVDIDNFQFGSTWCQNPVCDWHFMPTSPVFSD